MVSEWSEECADDVECYAVAYYAGDDYVYVEYAEYAAEVSSSAVYSLADVAW